MNTASEFSPTKRRDVDSPKGAVSELYAQVGGVKMVMNRLGIGRSQAYAFTDPQSDEELSVARAAALTSPTATAVAEFLCFMAGGVYMPIADLANCGAPSLKHIADQSRDHGGAIAAILGAISDGDVSSRERDEVLPHIDAALRGLARLRASMLAIPDAE